MAMASDLITLVVPARRQALGVLRTMAGNAARLSGFGYNRVEEARLAVNEAASLLVADGRSSSVRCSIAADPGSLQVEMAAHPGPAIWPPEPWADALEHVVLAAVTDYFELSEDGGPVVRLSLNSGASR
jgi:anti-sigma regulatory factor (Ser/Thr protein kinase)